MDRMARQGVRFTNCLSGAPLCTPYRATLQTGRYLHEHGVEAAPCDDLARFRGFAQDFGDAGYDTCYIGKTHWYQAKSKGTGTPKNMGPGFVPPEQRMGWCDWMGGPTHAHYQTRLYDDDGNVRASFPNQYEPPLQTDWATQWIGDRAGDKPWLMQLNFGPPHSCYNLPFYSQPNMFERMRQINRDMGFNIPEDWLAPHGGHIPQIILPQHLVSRIVPQEFLDLYDPESLTLEPNVEKRWLTLARHYYREYYAMITSVDREIGRILDYLKMTGADKNTLVIYTSDHGDRLCSFDAPRGKNTPYQNSMRVPLLCWGAGVPEGSVVDPLVNTVDLPVSLCGLAGLSMAADVPGVDLSAWFTEADGPRQLDILVGLRTYRGIYDGRYVYAIEADDEPDNPGWHVWHLIDTRSDPYDLCDLQHDPDHAEVMRVMHDRLLERLAEEGDHVFLERVDLSPGNIDGAKVRQT